MRSLAPAVETGIVENLANLNESCPLACGARCSNLGLHDLLDAVGNDEATDRLEN
jgi:hypothetical protein